MTATRMWIVLFAALMCGSLGGISEAASTAIVTLIDNGPTAGVAFLPTVPTQKFRSVAVFAKLGPNASFPVAVECRFTLEAVSDFTSSPTVAGFSGSVNAWGFSEGAAAVLGPYMLCMTRCDLLTPCAGTITLKALFSK